LFQQNLPVAGFAEIKKSLSLLTLACRRGRFVVVALTNNISLLKG